MQLWELSSLENWVSVCVRVRACMCVYECVCMHLNRCADVCASADTAEISMDYVTCINFAISHFTYINYVNLVLVL